jgi:hypothetical protein
MHISPQKMREVLTPAQEKFQAYVELVKAEMGDIFDDDEEGVRCTGEPSIDPSKSVQPNQGDSEWMDDW